MARHRRRSVARPRIASSRRREFLVRRSGRRVRSDFREKLRESRARPRRRRLALDPAAARARDDAAFLAQSLHLRRVRRARLGAHPLALQVGTDHVHPAHPRIALGPAARGGRDARAIGPDLGPRIRALQVAVCASAARGPVARSVVAADFAPSRRAGGSTGGGMSKPVIGFAGMTHLGVNSAAGALERGFRVVAFDDDVSVIEALRQARPPVIEPGLEEILRARKENITYSNRAADLRGCSVVYISTDVATDDDGRSDLGAVHKLIDKVLPELRPDALLVVLSQVPPGFTRTLALAPARLYYQVETLVFGRAVDRAVNPERFIVGCANPQAPLPVAYREFLPAMRYESAELAKIAINCCLVASVSVANTLAELCERIGAAWAEIAPALKLDKRIGPHAHLALGLGTAGGNLERDLATVIRLAGEAGTDAGVVKAWMANSRHRRDWAARIAKSHLLDKNPAAVVAVWGLAYKENTHSIK